jgi:sulfur carrier protein ThiS
MRIFLGGHLNFYHPKKEKWLVVHLDGPKTLSSILEASAIPIHEVHLAAVNGEVVEVRNTVVTEGDEVKVFSAVGGGA